jgi:glucosamine kinase
MASFALIEVFSQSTKFEVVVPPENSRQPEGNLSRPFERTPNFPPKTFHPAKTSPNPPSAMRPVPRDIQSTIVPYYLAIDAGGTKTECVLADEANELARARTGTIKLLRVGPEQAGANLASALADLSTRSGIDLRHVARTCIGTSGASVPLVADWIRQALAQSVGGDLILCGDEEIALDAAFHGGGGVLVLAGTGSNVAGRTRDGRLTSAGGWGPTLDDVGSGFWIGHEALRRAFRALDERIPSILIERVQSHWQLDSLAVLIQLANSTPPPDFSQLTRLVVECAEQGDPVAAEVLARGGRELAYLAQLIIERLREMEDPAFTLPDVAIAGSILGSIAPVRDAMTQALERAYPGVRVLPTPVDPALGALWRARSG